MASQRNKHSQSTQKLRVRSKSRGDVALSARDKAAETRALSRQQSQGHTLYKVVDGSPGPKVQGMNEEQRMSKIKFYQEGLDHRLSNPKRVTNRFIGFSL